MSLNPHITDLGSKVRLDWTPDPSCQGYRLYVDGVAVSRTFKPEQSSSTFSKPDANPHRYGVQRMDVIPALEEVTWPVAPATVSIPAYEITMPAAPNFHSLFIVHDSQNRQQVPGSADGDKHAILKWAQHGGQPQATGLYEGKVVHAIFGHRLIEGFPYRTFDFHTQPNDQPLGWNAGGGVAPIALDISDWSNRGTQFVLEPEFPNHEMRIFDVAETEQRRGKWQWIRMELGFGANKDGYIHVWVVGETNPRISRTGISTVWKDQHQVTYWEGCYNATRFDKRCKHEIAATRFGRTLEEAKADRPTFFSVGTEGTPAATYKSIGTVEAPI